MLSLDVDILVGGADQGEVCKELQRVGGGLCQRYERIFAADV